ncbi:ankyrin repeat domain-containing protein [Mangrovimonas sp. AS39]|uniref:ankyrin repeat domain-containing protein n=1 Tax=Mangrovimonas futianensis TaxID=2895523 RepID=UPI001E2AE129|nr:ankyrin repeat domain-containing protein [Mangrovimonas futianensis]MCF1192205.1 ankyrin repeat domain-containing protein [Mangrovimonas futianensis]MCF1196046.1 ankyrin repeat domain-containing protein [Mangrovimonas futianensis]
MKTLKNVTSNRILSTAILFLLLLNSCAQSDKKTAKNTPAEVIEKVDKPHVDIHTAVLTGNLEAVKQHIDAGTNINQKEAMSGSTPLISAVTFNKQDIAKALIDAKADMSIKNNDGSTALHTAAFFGRIEMVQMLIDAKADKTIRNNFGATPRETVLANFEEVKPIYDMLKLQLEPLGFELDMEALKKARPVVAMMLQ